MSFEIISFFAGLIIGGLITALLFVIVNRNHKADKESIGLLTQSLNDMKSQFQTERDISEQRAIQVAHLESEKQFLEQQNREKVEEMRGVQKRLTSEFEVIANKILAQQSKDLNDIHSQKLTDILLPLKNNIQTFEKTVSETYEKELRDKLSLQAEVKRLYELNHKISEEAENLTKALKGDVKKMGNWGEFILERILEDSGLTNGREYQREVVDHNQDGKLIRPDVVIYLPENKHLIIDSKLSLVAYERYINSSDKTEKAKFLLAHVESMRQHIKGLYEKNYSTARKLNAPDFVLMFLPLESSFAAAIDGDTELFSFAWERKIVPVSPSTLLATLRIVSSIWKQEKQNQNAQEIARQGGALYDKLAGLMQDLLKIGKSIDQLQDTYSEVVSKMSTGKGNLLNRAKKIKQLGAKTNKSIPDESSFSGLPSPNEGD